MAASDEPHRASARAMALVDAYGQAEFAAGEACADDAESDDGVAARAHARGDVAASALLAYLAALEAALDFYADPARYHTWRPSEYFPGYTTDAQQDGGAIARAARDDAEGVRQ